MGIKERLNAVRISEIRPAMNHQRVIQIRRKLRQFLLCVAKIAQRADEHHDMARALLRHQ